MRTRLYGFAAASTHGLRSHKSHLHNCNTASAEMAFCYGYHSSQLSIILYMSSYRVIIVARVALGYSEYKNHWVWSHLVFCSTEHTCYLHFNGKGAVHARHLQAYSHCAASSHIFACIRRICAIHRIFRVCSRIRTSSIFEKRIERAWITTY